MDSNSVTSSMEVDNGSYKSQSYRHDRPSQSPHISSASLSYNQYLASASQTAADAISYHAFDGDLSKTENSQYESGENPTESYSQTANGPSTFLPSTKSAFARHSNSNQDYYLHRPASVQEPVYANDINVKNEQNGIFVSNSNYPDQTQPRVNDSTGSDHYSRRSISHTDSHGSLSMRRWSQDNAPEERLRVGLPRWENKQHRIAYGESNVYGHDGGHEHNCTEPRHQGQRSHMHEPCRR